MCFEKYARQTIKQQERMLKNSQFFLKKSNDPYGLIKDKEFSNMLAKLISPNHYNRPNVRDILKSKFV